MAKRSIFRDFIALLRKDWQSTFPWIRPIEESLPPLMPKASTFYAGLAGRSDTHIFLNLQHSAQPWKVGQFTINIILSQWMGLSPNWTQRSEKELESLAEGYYRIGPVNGQRDKWWRLKPEVPSGFDHILPPLPFEGWQPTSYDDPDAVLAEAVADVGRDVASALRRIGVEGN